MLLKTTGSSQQGYSGFTAMKLEEKIEFACHWQLGVSQGANLKHNSYHRIPPQVTTELEQRHSSFRNKMAGFRNRYSRVASSWHSVPPEQQE